MESSSKVGGRRGLTIVVVCGVALMALAADRVSKMWAVSSLIEGQSTPVVGNFISFNLIHNPGAAFSMGEGSTWIFTILSFVVVAAIIWYVISGKVKSVVLAILIGIVGGGAIGNLIDRLIQPPSFGQGHVIDFINYNNWFVGNVADIWIVGGAIALIMYFLISDQQTSTTAVQAGQDTHE